MHVEGIILFELSHMVDPSEIWNGINKYHTSHLYDRKVISHNSMIDDVQTYPRIDFLETGVEP